MKLRELVEAGRFVIVIETQSPGGVDPASLLEMAEQLGGNSDAISVSDTSQTGAQLGSLTACHALKDRGIEPLGQLNCRDRNRIALQSDLLSAAALGVENLLILNGEHPRIGGQPHAKPVYDVDAIQWLEIASRLRDGEDLNGQLVQNPPDICLGTVVRTGREPRDLLRLKLQKVAQAGAEFVVSQPLFDPDQLEPAVRITDDLGLPLFAGILLLESAEMARTLNAESPALRVPESLIEELAGAQNPTEASIGIATRLIQKATDTCQGVYVMAPNRESHIPQALANAGIPRT